MKFFTSDRMYRIQKRIIVTLIVLIIVFKLKQDLNQLSLSMIKSHVSQWVEEYVRIANY